jgi:hydrogenase maturation protein HypF
MDAVAALIGVRQRSTFEGQAAMELEFAADGIETVDAYPFGIEQGKENGSSVWVADWRPMVRGILEDIPSAVAAGRIAAKFHNTLVEIIVAVSRCVGELRVVLTGGCFQNRYLTERAVARLCEEGFFPYWHQRVPPNDGGIALGQAVMGLYSICSRRA